MNSYRGLLQTRGVARILISQIVARFPSGMIVLALLIHTERIFDSYGSAGLVLAATSIGQGIAGPITSRLMGRFGARRVLVLTTLVCASALLVIALAPVMPLIGYILVALVGGLSFPPVQPAARTMYPKLVEPARLPRLFSLDASAQEIIWVTGPMIITLVAMQVSSVVGLVMCAALLVLGGAWFIASPELGEVRFAPSSVRFGSVLLRRPVLVAALTGFMLIGGLAAMEVAIVGRFGEGGIEAGVILGFMSLASLAAGLAFGHRRFGPFTLAMWIGTAAVGAVVATLLTGFGGTLLAVGIAGIGIAPALSVMSQLVADSIDFSESAEAYGWANTGQLVGAAAGSAVAGFFIDFHGPAGGFLTGAVIALLGVLIAAALAQQERRGRAARA